MRVEKKTPFFTHFVPYECLFERLVRAGDGGQGDQCGDGGEKVPQVVVVVEFQKLTLGV